MLLVDKLSQLDPFRIVGLVGGVIISVNRNYSSAGETTRFGTATDGSSAGDAVIVVSIDGTNGSVSAKAP